MDLETYLTDRIQDFLESKETLTESDLNKSICKMVDHDIIDKYGESIVQSMIKLLSKKYLDHCYKVNTRIRKNTDLHVYSGKKYKEDIYIYADNQISLLKSIPQYRQKSKEWLAQREKCISATAVAAAVNEDPHKTAQQLLMEKAGIYSAPFILNKFTHHGNKYEEITNLAYGMNENVYVYEYGLIPSSKYHFLSASPDGIVDRYDFERKRLTTMVGRMVEIKNPFPTGRVIKTTGEIDGEICPHQYYCQVQTQMDVCELEKCDFVQTKIEEYSSYEEFIEDAHPTKYWISSMYNNYRGAIIQLLPKKKTMANNTDWEGRYIYPPRLDLSETEYQKWIAEMCNKYREVVDGQEDENDKKFANKADEILRGSDYVFDKVLYWRIRQYHCITINRDKEWFAERVKIIEQFWSYITFFKENPAEKDKCREFIETHGYKLDDPTCTPQIFKYIHTRYIKSNPDAKYKEIFQELSKYCKPHKSWETPDPPGPKVSRNFFANRVNKNNEK